MTQTVAGEVGGGDAPRMGIGQRPGPVRTAGRASGLAAAVLVGLGSSAVALALAPVLMPPGYRWVSHTTSESAAQGVSGAWLARLGFVLFGLSVMALAFVAVRRLGGLSAALHFAFGALMTAAAAFSTRSWTGGPYDRTEDALHSVAASAMGVAFAAGVVAAMVHVGRRTGRAGLVLSIAAVASSVIVPVAMSALPAYDGLFQRVMFGIAYAWYAKAALDIR